MIAARVKKRWRLAVCATHPIQYQVPLYRRLADHPQIDLMVYYQTDTGLREKTIEGYGETIRWDIPLLDGYAYKVLSNVSPVPDTSKPWATINPAIVAELLKCDYTALIINDYFTVTDWLAFASARLRRTPIFFKGEALVNSGRKIVSNERLGDYLRKTWCSGLSAALAVSTCASEYYAHYGVPAGRVFWTPLAVDNDHWERQADALLPQKEQIRASLGLEPERPVLLLVAHLREQKRPMDLMQAFERLKDRVNLVIVGAGPLFEQVEQYCQERALNHVHLVGAKNQTELPQYYAAADIFVMTSGIGEVNPLVVHEAMCFRLPLILSDAIPSIVDVISEGNNGYTYAVGNIDELVERIDGMLADPSKLIQMGQCSRDINSGWSYDVCVKGIVDALAYVAGEERD
jgi:glycosyltransferase involved in cell wall biosynthesis